ncbi:MAG: hypothetical protein R6X05_17545 [Desulfobacterales bacterium]|jgi:hypothetical protein
MNQADDLEARRQRWERSRRKWYNIYLFAGVGINFVLYFTKPFGFDPSHSILWGSFFGIGIPLLTMLVCGFIHQKVLGL